MSEVLRALPDSEKVWERIYKENGPLQFVITSDKRREAYYLYRVSRGPTPAKILSFERMGKAKTPPEFWRKFGGIIKEVTEDE